MLSDLLSRRPSWLAAPAIDGRPRLILAGDSLDHWFSSLIAGVVEDAALAEAIDGVFAVEVLEIAEDPRRADRLLHAGQLTGGTTGWPLVVAALPDGTPFGASGWKRPHELASLVLDLAELWHGRPGDCHADAQRLAAAWAELSRESTGKALKNQLFLDQFEAAAMAVADPLEGGFGPPPRTAEPALWDALLRRAVRPEAPLALTRQVERSLAALCAGAAHDHVAGGFHRGCSDAAWREPLAEKRLADQAQIADLLRRAGEGLQQPLWRDVAARALHFTCDALRLPDGRFARGIHADSAVAAGRWESGAYYRWSAEQVAAVVGEEGAALVARRFGLPAEGDGFLAVGEAVDGPAQRRLPELIARLAGARLDRAAPRRAAAAPPREQAMIAHTLALAGDLDQRFATIARDLRPHLTGSDPWTGRALFALGDRAAAEAIATHDVPAHGVDAPGGVSEAAVLAHLRLDLGDAAGAAAIIDRARDRLRAAPLALAGLVGVYDRLCAH